MTLGIEPRLVGRHIQPMGGYMQESAPHIRRSHIIFEQIRCPQGEDPCGLTLF